MLKTAVVILNYNTREYLRRFLPGLIASCDGLDAEVIVADNASHDGSLEMMAGEFPSIRTIALSENYGFTGGYNRALDQVQAQYYVLINSDVEVPEHWLRVLQEWMDSHPECGACGPKLISFNDHMEEIDLCWRMQLRGWKVTVVPQSYVYHIGGGTLPNESPFKLRLNFRNNLLLLENNLPATLNSRFRARLRILTRMCLDGLSALVYLFTGRKSFYDAVVQAHREYRKLRRPGEIPAERHKPVGLYKGWIVPKGLF